jgi:hypothetical protein
MMQLTPRESHKFHGVPRRRRWRRQQPQQQQASSSAAAAAGIHHSPRKRVTSLSFNAMTRAADCHCAPASQHEHHPGSASAISSCCKWRRQRVCAVLRPAPRPLPPPKPHHRVSFISFFSACPPFSSSSPRCSGRPRPLLSPTWSSRICTRCTPTPCTSRDLPAIG